MSEMCAFVISLVSYSAQPLTHPLSPCETLPHHTPRVIRIFNPQPANCAGPGSQCVWSHPAHTSKPIQATAAQRGTAPHTPPTTTHTPLQSQPPAIMPAPSRPVWCVSPTPSPTTTAPSIRHHTHTPKTHTPVMVQRVMHVVTSCELTPHPRPHPTLHPPIQKTTIPIPTTSKTMPTPKKTSLR